jgi:hypothetical protein
MAELKTPAETTATSCCAPETQAVCCEPSAKAECCHPSHGDRCGLAFLGCGNPTAVGAFPHREFTQALADAGFLDVEIRETHRVHAQAASAIVRAPEAQHLTPLADPRAALDLGDDTSSSRVGTEPSKELPSTEGARVRYKLLRA